MLMHTIDIICLDGGGLRLVDKRLIGWPAVVGYSPPLGLAYLGAYWLGPHSGRAVPARYLCVTATSGPYEISGCGVSPVRVAVPLQSTTTPWSTGASRDHMFPRRWLFLVCIAVAGARADREAESLFDIEQYRACLGQVYSLEEQGPRVRRTTFVPAHKNAGPLQACDASHFELLSPPLGRGLTSLVYKARVSAEACQIQGGILPKQVAIKQIPGAEDFVQAHLEACLLAASSSKHLPRLFCSYEHDGAAHLVMELVEGATVADLVNPRFPDRHTASAILQHTHQMVLEAGLSILELYHQHGIILRDLKPENALVSLGTDGPAIKFIDFGMAAPKEHPLMANKWWGTPSSFPPAYFHWDLDKTGTSKPLQDEQSDRYALGLILLTLATGKLPFAAVTRKSLPHQVIDQAWRQDLDQLNIGNVPFKERILELLDSPINH